MFIYRPLLSGAVPGCNKSTVLQGRNKKDSYIVKWLANYLPITFVDYPTRKKCEYMNNDA